MQKSVARSGHGCRDIVTRRWHDASRPQTAGKRDKGDGETDRATHHTLTFGKIITGVKPLTVQRRLSFYLSVAGADGTSGFVKAQQFISIKDGKLVVDSSYMDIDDADQREDWPGDPGSVDHLIFPPGEEIYP